MKLSKILADIVFSGNYTDADVIKITESTSEICDGCVFVCIKGARFDGHTKAAEALENGAVAVVTEKDLGLPNQIVVENSRSAYSLMCAAFYSHPEKNLKFIGITGTNGKTTSAFVIKDVLEATGHKTGMIGTVKNMIGDIEMPANFTTPSANELFTLLSKMVAYGCEYCVMEVSSQGLAQHRTDGIHYDAAIFTNLTQDHLDYHGTIEAYKEAKHRLFENADIAVLNYDDEAADYMVSDTSCRKVTFSMTNDSCDYTAKNVRSSASGVKYELVANNNIGRVSFHVPGLFNVYNSMGAIIALVELGIDFKQVLDAVAECVGVPGRMEVVPTETPYTVIIDYAHTPDGLENVLTSLRKVTDGRIIAVFGCGGDRDKTKRPIMGGIGATLADVAVITSDNPRTEDPDEIIADVLEGTTKHTAKIIVEVDRTKAIGKALSIAEEGDVVVLAGKGHETYQILSTGKIHYDEREVVASLLK